MYGWQLRSQLLRLKNYRSQELDPNQIHIPGIMVQRIFKGEKFEKRIERTTRKLNHGLDKTRHKDTDNFLVSR
jgi:hypothetical protein